MKQVMALAALFLIASCQAPQPAQQPTAQQAGLMEGIATGKTRIIDLTHPLNPQNPYWPGPGYGPFRYELFATLEKDGVLSGRFALAEIASEFVDPMSGKTVRQLLAATSDSAEVRRIAPPLLQ